MTQMARNRLTFRDPLWPARFAQVLIGLYSLLQLVYTVVVMEAQDNGLAWTLLVADCVSTIAAWVAFLVWFRRCRDNAEVRVPGSVAYTRGWALGAWFNPLYMWWRPRRIAMDIYRAGVDSNSPDANSRRLINAWWVAWIATLFPFGDLINEGTYAVINLVAAILAVMVIQRISDTQTRDALPTPTLVALPSV